MLNPRSRELEMGEDKLRILIVANGVLEDDLVLDQWAAQCDLVIAADGGADHCLSAGIVPDIIIGDLDSISAPNLDRLKKKSKKIIPYPVEKDYTDLELALRYANQQGGREMVVVGALGARWDMSAANLMLLGADFLKHKVVRLVESRKEIRLLRGGDQVTLTGQPEDIVSLIPLGQDAVGVTTEGLLFPLKRERLTFSATRGVSNQMKTCEATIRLDSGLLLCFHHCQHGVQ